MTRTVFVSGKGYADLMLQTLQTGLKGVSMAEFRVGDKVRCLDSSGTATGKLVKGDVYSVESIQYSQKWLRLEGLPQFAWYPTRFELVSAANQPDASTEDWAIAAGLRAPKKGDSMTVPDPGKPFPDPVAEREKTAEEKLREYRKSVRQMIGL